MYQGVVFPVSKPRVTLPFAVTRAPYTPGNPHRGVDLAPWPGSRGEPVFSVMRAQVVQAGDSGGGLGNVVITKGSLPYDVWATNLRNQVQTIKANTPFYLIYAHLERVMVGKEQIVTPGRQLGTIGESGFTFGPHLHLELRVGNFNDRNVLNPMDMMVASIVGLKDEIVHA